MMTTLAIKRKPEGLFNRVYSLFGVLKKLPDRLSEEELEGVVKVLPPDTANTFSSLLKPSIQEAGLAFLKLLLTWLEEAVQAKKDGKKVVLLPFNFPPEIVHAFDNLYPLTSEVLTTLGVAALEGQGERYWNYAMGLGLPDHLCSANTIELGSILTGVDFKPDVIISGASGACDVNAKIHEFVSLYMDVPQIILEKPTDDTKRGRAYFLKNYLRMIKELEAVAGEELKEENLYRVAATANRCTELYYDLWELKKHVPCPVPGVFSLLLAGTRFAMWGREEAIDVLESMIRVSRRNLEDEEYNARGEVARLIFTYLSYYFDFVRFYDWLEEKRINTFGDFLQVAFLKPIDLTSMETMLEGIVDSAWTAVMTRQMGSSSMSLKWIDDVVHVIKEWNINAAVYCGHHSCKQTWSVFSMVRSEIMKRSKIPTLMLQGDSWIRRMTPMSALDEQIDEFVNNVLKRKRATAATEVG